MGRIKTSFIKNIGRELFSKHSDKITDDYKKNKEIMKGFVEFKSKKQMNIVTGYVTNLKRQQLREKAS